MFLFLQMSEKGKRSSHWRVGHFCVLSSCTKGTVASGRRALSWLSSIHSPPSSGSYATWPKPKGQRKRQRSNDTWCSNDNELVEEQKFLNMQHSPRIIRHKGLSESNSQGHPLISKQNNTEKVATAETYILRNRISHS